MDEFEKLVGELKAATGNKEIVEKLQAIMSKLLTECVIQVGSFEVEPLLVEAYYYNVVIPFNQPEKSPEYGTPRVI